MRAIAIVIGFVMFTFVAGAQVVPQYTNFMFTRQSYNPAVAGSESYVDITGLFRAQWVGIKGAPLSGLISAHAPISRISSGVGLVISNEQTGEQRVTQVMLNYAYGKTFRFGRLSGGVSVGFYQKALAGDKLKAPQGTYDNGVNHNDDYIPNTAVSGIAPEVNAGIYFNNDKAYAGVSVANLVQSKVTLQTASTGSEIRDVRTFIAMAGYSFAVGRNLHLIPNVMVVTEFKNVQTNINLLLQYKDNFYGGLAFRGYSGKSMDALSALVGLRVYKDFSIGYSYDFSLSALNNANSGSHEVYLNYKFKLKDWSKPGKAIYNPRFL